MSKPTVIVTVVLATIERGTEVTISDTFFEHEIPILELIHGEDNVKVLNDDYHAIELPNNATQEYQRLITKYGEKYRSVIDQVFRAGPRDVAKELGMDVGKDSFKRQPAWPTDMGALVQDGTINWRAVPRRVEDERCPRTKVVAIVASKVFAADKDIVRYSATANPLDWSTADDAGYLPTGLQQANSNDVAVLAPYRANLAPMNASSFQNWQVDPDPASMALLDQMDGIGSVWPKAAIPVANDLFYLSQLGVRTIGIANAAENLASGDVGAPIDILVQEALRVAAANGSKVVGTYYPGVIDHHPRVVLIDYALNDRGLPLAQSRQNLTTIIRAARAAGACPVLLTPTWDTDASPTSPGDKLGAQAAMIRTLGAAEHVPVADSLQAFVSFKGDRKTLMAQSNHPNRAGHALVVRQLLPLFNLTP